MELMQAFGVILGVGTRVWTELQTLEDFNNAQHPSLTYIFEEIQSEPNSSWVLTASDNDDTSLHFYLELAVNFIVFNVATWFLPTSNSNQAILLPSPSTETPDRNLTPSLLDGTNCTFGIHSL